MLLLTLILIAAAATASLARVHQPQYHAQPKQSLVVQNANHIFNAIHSSMRQWGSSLNHNGMSFFIGQISAGTELYHGQGEKDPMEGPDWFAFEPEHALQFAWVLTPYTNSSLEKLDLTKPQFAISQNILGRRIASVPQPDQVFYHVEPGFFHTYTILRDLHILYIDGQSAAKTSNGTLDTQDYVLTSRRGSSTSPDGSRVRESPRSDYERAIDFCDISRHVWKGHIDGFIRMEFGFELILCDIPSIANATSVRKAWPGNGLDGYDVYLDRMALFRAITSRYHGIGEGRVALDFESMVTAYAYDVDLFNGNKTAMPRLQHMPQSDLDTISNDLTQAVLENAERNSLSPNPINWQAVADMIVKRYSDTLQDIAFGQQVYNSKADLDDRLTLFLRPFIDFDARNTTLETSRCSTHFIPRHQNTTTSSSIAHQAISEVSSRICTTLFATLTRPATLEAAQQAFKDLTTWLAWTTWKDCRPSCPPSDFCFTAIWPYGDKESHERPYCIGPANVRRLRNPVDNYWWET